MTRGNMTLVHGIRVLRAKFDNRYVCAYGPGANPSGTPAHEANCKQSNGDRPGNWDSWRAHLGENKMHHIIIDCALRLLTVEDKAKLTDEAIAGMHAEVDKAIPPE